jgi:hypothetical protein
MQKCAQGKPNIHKKQRRKKKQIVEKRPMILFFTKNSWTNEYVFAVEVGNKTAYGS